MGRNPKLLSKFQTRCLRKLCEEEFEDPRSSVDHEHIRNAYAVLQDENYWELSEASQEIEKLLVLQNEAPGSQPYECFELDHLIYIIARLFDSIQKAPPEDFDGRWSTVVSIIKRMLGPQLNLGHGLTRTRTRGE